MHAFVNATSPVILPHQNFPRADWDGFHPQFSQVSNTIPLPTSPLYSPEEIVQRIKGELMELAPSSVSTSNGNAGHPPIEPRNSAQLSQRDRAMRVVEDNRISVDVRLHTFTNLGSERPHVVALLQRRHAPAPPLHSAITSLQQDFQLA